jgi:hypothetical protein
MLTEQLARLSIRELRDLAAAYSIRNPEQLPLRDLIAALTRVAADAPPDSGGRQGLSSASLGGGESAPARGPNPGLPIPDRYGRDCLVLMTQDPHHIFAYWELSEDTLARARAQAGEAGTTVLVLSTAHGAEQREIDLRSGNYYLTVAPNSDYEAQLALRDSRGNLIPLVRSNRIRTPAATVSSRQDQAWMTIDEQFNELLELAGLPGNFGGSMGRLGDRTQREVAWAWQDSHLKPWSSGAWSSHSLSSFSLGHPPNDVDQRR